MKNYEEFIPILHLLKTVLSFEQNKKLLEIRVVNGLDILFINNEFQILLTEKQSKVLQKYLSLSINDYFKDSKLEKTDNN